MVKDKINYRARGPNTVLTRQPVQGRANDGGLRIGEMERDGVMAHGMSYFLNDSFMVRGEKQDFFIAICNKSGAVAIYNESRNLFLSPFADGPIKFNMNPDGTQSILNLSKFGRSFSLVKVPYAFKLLIQELQVMNVQMRIITEDNVDQLLNMNFSDNINKLMNSDKQGVDLIREIKKMVSIKQTKKSLPNWNAVEEEKQELPDPVTLETPLEPIVETDSPEYIPGTPAYEPPPSSTDTLESSQTPTVSPPLQPQTPTETPPLQPQTPTVSPPTADVVPLDNPVNILDVEPPAEEKADEEVTEKEDGEIKKITL